MKKQPQSSHTLRQVLLAFAKPKFICQTSREWSVIHRSTAPQSNVTCLHQLSWCLTLCTATWPRKRRPWCCRQTVLALTLLPESVWKCRKCVHWGKAMFHTPYASALCGLWSQCSLPLSGSAVAAPRHFITVLTGNLDSSLTNWFIAVLPSYDGAMFKVTELYSQITLYYRCLWRLHGPFILCIHLQMGAAYIAECNNWKRLLHTYSQVGCRLRHYDCVCAFCQATESKRQKLILAKRIAHLQIWICGWKMNEQALITSWTLVI